MKPRALSSPLLASLALVAAACGGASANSTPAPVPAPSATAAKPAADDGDTSAEDGRKCDAGDGAACFGVAGYYAYEKKDDAAAKPWFVKGCQLRNADCCGALSLLESDPAKRHALEEKACELGDAGACFMLGTAAMDKDDPRAAHRYFERACHLDKQGAHGAACDLVKSLDAKGFGR